MGAEEEVRAHLARAAGYAAAGDTRAAASFVAAAARAAEGVQALRPSLQAELAGAEAYVRRAAAAYQARLERALAEAEAGPRLDDALAILLGRKPVPPSQATHPQLPSVLYVPGLPERFFYEASEFPWAEALEAETPAVRAELESLLGAGAEFQPYVEAPKNRPDRELHRLAGDASWTAFYLWKDGAPVPENAARCPRTIAALERVPLSRIGSRTPSVLFSLLRPGAHIPAHHGMLNSRLICHLPLIVPPDCWLRVGGETRAWEEGKLMVFDDSVSHDARNGSDSLRVVLLFDIWRPELDAAERRGLSAIFDAIDAVG
jgi:aspartate beta-hydroxylase